MFVSELGVKYLLDILFTCPNIFVLMQVLELLHNLLLFGMLRITCKNCELTFVADATRNSLSQAFDAETFEKLKAHLVNMPMLLPLLIALETLMDN